MTHWKSDTCSIVLSLLCSHYVISIYDLLPVQAGGGGGGVPADQEGLPHHRPHPRPGRQGAAQEARGHQGLVQHDQGDHQAAIDNM